MLVDTGAQMSCLTNDNWTSLAIEAKNLIKVRVNGVETVATALFLELDGLCRALLFVRDRPDIIGMTALKYYKLKMNGPNDTLCIRNPAKQTCSIQ